MFLPPLFSLVRSRISRFGAFGARVLPDWGWAGCASQTIVDEAGLAACQVGLENGDWGVELVGLVSLVGGSNSFFLLFLSPWV